MSPDSNPILHHLLAFWRLLQHEWQQLSAFNPSDRRWQMPVAAALSTGLPLLVGAWFERLDYGLVSSLGGLAFLYLPATPMHHRMVSLMASAFALCACYALGLMSHALAVAVIPILTLIAMLVVMLCRYYALGPPGSLFFVMTAAIGAYSPVPLLQWPLMVGLIFMGALLACMIAFLYSLHDLRIRAPAPVAPLPAASFDFVVFDAVIIGLFVGLSLLLATALQLDRPYWVPISCLAVIQGVSLRAVWNRQLHRVAGTALGLGVAWLLLWPPHNPWTLALTMIALAFVIEVLVVRHYGLATVFITPLTLLLAEAATLGQTPHALLFEARFVDTVLGCLVGMFGGVCLHSPGFRAAVGGRMRRLIPGRYRKDAAG